MPTSIALALTALVIAVSAAVVTWLKRAGVKDGEFDRPS